MQFHPTGLAYTGILLLEVARTEGGILRDVDDKPSMRRYTPEYKDLAARDVVPRSITVEAGAGCDVTDPKDPGGPEGCVWPGTVGTDSEHMKEMPLQVVETIRQYASLDPAEDLVSIKPTAYYTMGDISITTDGEVYH